MFRSPLGRKLSVRTRVARRLILVLSLFAVAAIVPFINAGAWQQEDEVQPLRTQSTAKGQANVVDGAEFVPGEVLVRFRSDAAAKMAEAAPMSLQRAEDGGEVTFQRFEGSDIVDGLRVAKVEETSTLDAVAELAARPDVLYAEPNYVRRKFTAPNDPDFIKMWGLRNTGQSTPTAFSDETASGIPGVDIGMESAWDTTQGSDNVVVGVVDEGFDFNHPDLAANVWTNPSDDADLGFPGDIHGWDFFHNDATTYDNPSNTPGGNAPDSHGTHVAGTIGAVGNNNRGVTGINWRVKLMSLKILGDENNDNDNPAPSSVKATVRAYSYATQMRARWRTSGGTRGANIRVLNNSYGGTGKSQAELEAINALAQEGILFVAAAGNDNTDNFSAPKYPTNYDAPNLISVAATDHNDHLASYSNFGARAVSIGAPGSAILSTTPANTYSYFWGTSMAAPHVTGAAALICAANPNITLSQLRGALAFTGNRIPALDGKTTTGRRLNVANAIASALENDTTAPAAAGNFRVTGQSGRSVTLAWTAPGDDGNTGTAADYDLFFVNSTTQAKTLLPTSLVPAAAGSQQAVTVDAPFRNFSGTIQLRAYDNAGNSSVASVAVNITVNSGSDPYTVTESAAQSLTNSTATNLFPNGGDDKYAGYTLPFSFPFYGVSRTTLTVSTNGALYFSTPPRRDNNDANDSTSSSEGLQGQTMIAGLWDDIDLNRTARADSGIYVTQEASRVVFRWQGIPCNPTVASGGTCTGGSPINFEIELRSDGTIQMRYGSNPGMFPVVGISGGEPDAYVVASHTSETQRLSLSGAQTVTFAPRVAARYSISGSVRDANGVGVPNVTLFLSGGGSGVTMSSGTGGNYSFTNLASDLSYTVTPSHPDYNFTPPSINIASLTSDQGANFVAALKAQAGPNSVGFAQASYQYGEGDGRATFTVTRTGDTASTVTLDYRTVDTDTFNIGCADTVNNNGGAFARCDFAATVGRLSFAAGELSKTITVPLIDDGHDENAETFQLQLSNAAGSGTTLGAQNVATATINDNDEAGARNPIITLSPSDYSFFVRQQYLDFLSREPEPSEPWTAVMNRCPSVNTGPAVNTDCDRIAVSRAFFEAPEFNLKGFYAFRFYKVAFNRLPQYTEIVTDMSFLAGATEAEVYARRAQLANAFVARQEFANAYNGMNNEQFVATLLNRYGLAITTPDPFNPDGGTKVFLTRPDLMSRLDSGLLTRAQVLRAIADSDQVFAQEFNSAFVAVQYYGYLRRTPEDAGYQANLNALLLGTSRREMINGFLNSTEYRLRFGQP